MNSGWGLFGKTLGGPAIRTQNFEIKQIATERGKRGKVFFQTAPTK